MEQTTAAENAEYVSARLWRNWYRSRVDHQTTEGPRRAGEEWAGEGVPPPNARPKRRRSS